MRKTPVAEEQRHDHAHFTVHYIIPHPASSEPPSVTVTSARHINDHLIATGPLFAIAVLDMPYPLPGFGIAPFISQCLAETIETIDEKNDLIVYGTGGRLIKETLLPQPPPIMEPLW